MRKAGYASSERATRVLRRIGRAIANGLVTDAPDDLVHPLLGAAVLLTREPTRSVRWVVRAEAALAALEDWAEKTVPIYTGNPYARTWTRLCRDRASHL